MIKDKYEDIIESPFDTNSCKIEDIRSKDGYIVDLDAVILCGNKLLPGINQFVEWIVREEKQILFVTNSNAPSPKEIQQRVKRLGLNITEDLIYTSAQATATFLNSQKSNGTAFVLGEAGLFNALFNVGYTMNSVNPDFVVVGESTSHNYEKISKAIDLVLKGSRLIGTNPDTYSFKEDGSFVPSTAGFVSTIEMATNRKAYFIGKPNGLMMKYAMRWGGMKKRDVAIIGDRMDTTIIAGIATDVDTVLVMNGVTTREDLTQFAYRPYLTVNSIEEIVSEEKEADESL